MVLCPGADTLQKLSRVFVLNDGIKQIEVLSKQNWFHKICDLEPIGGGGS